MKQWRIILISSVVAAVLLAGCSSGKGDRLEITTSSDEARQLFEEGMAQLNLFHHAEAKDLFQKAIDKDPNFALGYLGLSFTITSVAHYETVLQADALSQPEVQLVPLKVGFGISLVPEAGAEMMKEATKRIDKVSDGERLWIQGQRAMSEGDEETALSCFRQMAAKYPKDERAFRLLGDCFYRFDLTDSALAAYRRATELDSTYAPAYNMLGYEYQATGDMAQAEAMFKRYAELLPTEPNPCDSYAEFLLRQGRYEESINCYQKALALDSTFVNARVGVATDLMLMGRAADARKNLTERIATTTDSAEKQTLLLTEALSYLYENEPDSCLAVAASREKWRSGKLDPIQEAGDLDAQGLILSHYGRYKEASERFDRALQVIQSLDLPVEIQNQRAMQYHQRMGCSIALPSGNLKDAEKHLAELEKLASNDAQPRAKYIVHYYRGLMGSTRKDYAGAIAEYEQSFTSDPLVAYQIGYAIEQMGNPEKALDYYKKAIAAPMLNSTAHVLIWLRVQEAIQRLGTGTA